MTLRNDDQVLKYITTAVTLDNDCEEIKDIKELEEVVISKPEPIKPDNKSIDAMDVILGFAHYNN